MSTCTDQPCFDGVECTDLAQAPGYRCGACPAGTEGDGTTCSDIDGCATSPCHAGVTCTDVPAPGTGSTCGACPGGTEGDGTTCTEVDGCVANPCHEGVACTDVPAPGTGFSCGACPTGHDGDGVTCTDHDACNPSPCFAGVACEDHAAPDLGYTCDPCPDGYRGDGINCIPETEFIDAATETANTNPACSTTALPEGFYWEIGDREGPLASGTVAGSDTPTASQVIAIASSSKWIYSTYVLEKTGSVLAADVPFLHFTSGYVFPAASAGKEVGCGPLETVAACAADVVLSPLAVDKFFYSAGHFQYHAANVMGLGAMRASALTTEVTATIGSFDFVYLQTNLAGGLNASASAYAAFLRSMLRGEYVMSSQLDSDKICASSACASGAVLSPAPPDEAWNYGLGHWVEDDPAVGDHAFSSAGALGFYPWIDASKTWYGVFARRAPSPGGNQGVVSLRCGRMIRQAWVTGVTATSDTPTPGG